MKRVLLVGLAAGFCFTANSQNNNAGNEAGRPRNQHYVEPSAPVQTTPFAKKPMTVPTSNAITVIDMGQSGNSYGVGFGARTFLWADPRVNAVTFPHRAAATPGTGFVQYDFSKDGGATWTSNVTCYSPDGTTHFNARYPQGVLYNPNGNTNADNAYAHYRIPTLAGTNGTWGGIAYGVHQISGAAVATQRSINANGAYQYLIPEAMTVTPTGIVYQLTNSERYSGTSWKYTDSVIISGGNFNTTTKDIDYTEGLVSVPVSRNPNDSLSEMIAQSIAFAPNGMTGYMAFIGHNNYTFQPDSAYYLIVYKTVNGGLAWTGPTNIDVKAIAATPLGSTALAMSTAFDMDMVVDKNGNPHIFVSIHNMGSGSWTVVTAAGTWGLFDVYSEDQGATFKGQLIAKPQTFRGTFGTSPNAFSEDSRQQTSTTIDGGKVFFTWFDTDTINYGTANLYPDAWSIGYDVTTKVWTNGGNPRNFTATTAADGSVTFGNVSHWVFTPTGKYEIPIAFQALTDNLNTLQQTQFKYIKGAEFTDADFVGVNELNNNVFTVNQNYPNPFSNSTEISVNLMKASEVNMTITNTLGQVALEIKSGKLSAGTHKFLVDGTQLNAGVYFYTVKAGDFSVTNKMIVQ